MLFSVWNWNSQNYDVFEADGEKPGQRPIPHRKVKDPNGRGRQLETLLPVVPKNAVRVGTAPMPRGRIALHWTSSVVGLGEDESLFVTRPWLTLGLIVGGVWLGHKALKAIASKM